MKKVFCLLTNLLLVCIFCFACTTGQNRNQLIKIRDNSLCENKESYREVPKTIDLLTWNIGYAALGANADFIADGGKSLFPSDKKIIFSNFLDIASCLREINPDIIFFEEMAGNSDLTKGIDLFNDMHKALPQYEYLYYSPQYANYLLFIHINIGNALFSKIRFSDVSILGLGNVRQHPLGPEEFQHFMKARIRIAPDKELVLYLVHLTAFDSRAEIRLKHLSLLKDDIISEKAAGNYVLCAGDWNLRLVNTDFPHTTEQKYLNWIFDLPAAFTPPGWKWHIDPAVPTVRTLEHPYREGENYTTIIDGILTSPGIVVHSCETLDFKFRNSDHNPVYIRFSYE